MIQKPLQRLLSLLLFLQFIQFCSAQTVKHLLNAPVFSGDCKRLRQPWVGGFNSPQFSNIDLNHDGLPDLFIFDKMASKPLTFINNGSHSTHCWDYAPEYESVFPAMQNWALIRDYNKDGVPDLFTHSSAGMAVYTGVNNGGKLSFNLFASQLLGYQYSNYSNIYVGNEDMPILADIDFDGDMDIIVPDDIISSTFAFFQNSSVQNGFRADSLTMTFVSDPNRGWGYFYGNGGGNLCGTTEFYPRSARDVAYSIFGIQLDCDSAYDVLIGNVNCGNLTLMRDAAGNGNLNNPQRDTMVTMDTLFPSYDRPVNLPLYPAAYQLDMDNDGRKDLVVAPNLHRYESKDTANILFYKLMASGTGCDTTFRYQNDTMVLCNEVLDFGSDSKPVLVDLNGDSLLDLIVSNYTYYTPVGNRQSALAYYENVGTKHQPRFLEKSLNYQNIKQFSFVSAYPAFGDLDGDGLPDMIIGDANGDLQYFKNTGTAAAAAFASLTTPQLDSLNVGNDAAPFLYDLNGDHLLDLIVGRRDGGISYFWNIGSRTFPRFKADSANLLFGNIQLHRVLLSGGVQPSVVKDNSGNFQLFVGSERGTIYKYLIDPNHLKSGSFLVSDSDYLRYNVGEKATITIADINNDGVLDYIVGNVRGGLDLFSDSIWATDNVTSLPTCTVNIVEDTKSLPVQMRLFPNPATNRLQVQIENEDAQINSLEVYDIVGKAYNLPFITLEKGNITLNTRSLSAGIYILRIQDGQHILTNRFTIER